MKIEYELTKEQQEKYRAWYREQNAEAAKHQIESGSLDSRPEIKAQVEKHQRPYPGCVSGGPTWIISTCGIGTSIKVKHWYTDAELDLTDYESW